jgi:hypothetical protein
MAAEQALGAGWEVAHGPDGAARGACATSTAVRRENWVARLSDGKIVESWPLPDGDAYLGQLGYQSVSLSL